MTATTAADLGSGHAGSVNRHFACFDGLRAIAATLIVMHHAGFASGDTFRYGWGAYVGRMDIGVPIFFGLSGFLLFRPYVAAQFAGTQPIGNADFWTRRVLRIFPAYWAALFLQVILGGIVVHSLFGLLVYMSLTQIYFMRYVIGAITQSWSLATEMSFYVFLPFWARWMRKLAGSSTINVQAMRLLGWLGVLVVLSYVWRGFIYWVDPSWKPLTYYWLPSLIELFCVGMALAVISAWADHRSVVREMGDAIGRHPAICWAIALGLFWFVSTQLGLLLGLFRASDSREMLRQTIYGLVAFFLMLPAVFGDQRQGLIRRFLSHRFMVFMGSISYGVYLWHQFFITHIQDWFGWGQWEAPFPQLFVMTMVLSSITAWISLKFLERPLMGQRKRVLALLGKA
jgi:peptidoglycan/LPS O-acetylase OafA/YrhL